MLALGVVTHLRSSRKQDPQHHASSFLSSHNMLQHSRVRTHPMSCRPIFSKAIRWPACLLLLISDHMQTDKYRIFFSLFFVFFGRHLLLLVSHEFMEYVTFFLNVLLTALDTFLIFGDSFLLLLLAWAFIGRQLWKLTPNRASPEWGQIPTVRMWGPTTPAN